MTTTSVHFQQLESASIPLRGASMEQVEAMIQKNMEADIPVGQDLGR